MGYRHRGGAEILFASTPAHDEIFAGNRAIGRIAVAVAAEATFPDGTKFVRVPEPIR